MAVFSGLMLGMFVSTLNLTLLAPAMPIIVAQLGGIEHYSWIAMSSIVTAAVAVPIVGKLSDLYGRKQFYMGGICLFMLGSVLSGLAPTFLFLIAARAVQGLGIGTIQPLSQAIIGDIVSPRERGKFQGLIGATFGLSSIVGPVLGGVITDHLTWRWLFFANLPVGVAALVVIGLYMHVPQVPRRHLIDIWGIVTLTLALVSGLTATVWGGSQYPWLSGQIIGLYAFAAVMTAVFLVIETRAAEPVLPLRLWRLPIFTLSNIATVGVAAAMYGAIYFIPVYVEGVQGRSAGNSGTVLLPMLLAMIVTSVLNGQLISRSGRYKTALVGGVALMGVGFLLLTMMDATTDGATVIRNMILIGLGLGASMQTFILIVQNAVDPADMGVATSATQLFRSVGSAVGVAVMGTLLTQGLSQDIARHLPAGAAQAFAASGRLGTLGAGAALDPSALAHLPPAILTGIRAGIADALHPVFVADLPFIAIALLAALLIREVPLRRASGVAQQAASAGPTGVEIWDGPGPHGTLEEEARRRTPRRDQEDVADGGVVVSRTEARRDGRRERAS
jgi:EmrB/QacA subfamily drug resistance transporter